MLVHLYYGEGKGKSTAAAGLALRALSAGFRVYMVRFLKGGGPESGEVALLKKCGAIIVDGKTTDKFTFRMTESEKEETRLRQDGLLAEFVMDSDLGAGAFGAAGDTVPDGSESDDKTSELLVLDEALAAVNYGLLSEELLKRVVTERPENREIVLTGRGPKEWMLEEADYITEFRCERHPYDKGIQARRGIEL
ncbi:MAG: cob(I)yrinic acid a,c-diamide adenosyltransferase [Lachnospiraceae bacterium]|nr:cob(I)yrinic acid a,c-diamide adenosyltransferase [Lachnospiraceae bacterium]